MVAKKRSYSKNNRFWRLDKKVLQTGYASNYIGDFLNTIASAIALLKPLAAEDSSRLSVGVRLYCSRGPGAGITPNTESARIFSGQGLSSAIAEAIVFKKSPI